jgi:hypothetical protein
MFGPVLFLGSSDSALTIKFVGQNETEVLSRFGRLAYRSV